MINSTAIASASRRYFSIFISFSAFLRSGWLSTLPSSAPQTNLFVPKRLLFRPQRCLGLTILWDCGYQLLHSDLSNPPRQLTRMLRLLSYSPPPSPIPTFRSARSPRAKSPAQPSPSRCASLFESQENRSVSPPDQRPFPKRESRKINPESEENFRSFKKRPSTHHDSPRFHHKLTIKKPHPTTRFRKIPRKKPKTSN